MTPTVSQTDSLPTWHAISAADVTRALQVDPRRGLSTDEARARLERYGPNEIQQGRTRTLRDMVVDQFRDVVIWVLLAATVISAAMGDFTDAAVIIAIVVLNAVMGVVQERKAEQSLAALRKLAAPTARALRDGASVEVPARDLVPGDVVLLEAGNYVPADGRLLEAVNLRVEEASLTGESEPVTKETATHVEEDAPVGDRATMVYTGTTVAGGRGRAVVVGTGAGTELGEIATLLGGIEAEKTPLQEKLEGLGRWLALVTLAVCAIVFAAGLLRGVPMASIFMTAVSLAVAAIPEGLPAIVTIVLAFGMQNMVRRNVIIRKLRAVEALGATTVICTDKTGTLTQNAMTVRRLFAGGRFAEVAGTGYAPEGEIVWTDGKEGEKGKAERRGGEGETRSEAPSPLLRPFASLSPSPSATVTEDLRTLLEIAALCNDAQLRERAGQWEIVGDPTEGALLVAAAKGGVAQDALEREHPRETEIPFDSDRKRMTTLHLWGDCHRALMKGAPVEVLPLCTHGRREGRMVRLTDAERAAILAAAQTFAEASLRVLACAYRDMSEPPSDNDPSGVETNLVFAGLMGMIDPPRPEVRPAVSACRAAGIRPVIITGDYATTALAIARELGIADDGTRALTGAELRRLGDAELQREVEAVTVYARVAPGDKLRLVEAFQSRGHIVAMTGDGVNDAPALKRADIGVAMGITGTDVAKGAADIVLTDDNFASIVAAVEEGRGIFDNIRKFVLYLLSCNVSEVLAIFLALLAGLPSPLAPVQILWVNLVTDGLPALALGAEPKEPGVMERPPRDPEEGVLTARTRAEIFWYSGAITGATLLAYLHGLYWHALVPTGHETFSEAIATLAEARFWPTADARVAQTMAFVTLALAQLAHSLNCRSERISMFRLGFFGNWRLLVAIALSVAAQLAVVYVPFLRPVFRTVPVTGRDLVVMLALPFLPLIVGEARKLFRGSEMPLLRRSVH